MTDLPTLTWRKSSRSGEDNCVEVAVLPTGGMAVRDSKDKDGPALTFTAGQWRAFVGHLKHVGLHR